MVHLHERRLRGTLHSTEVPYNAERFLNGYVLNGYCTSVITLLNGYPSLNGLFRHLFTVPKLKIKLLIMNAVMLREANRLLV